MLEDWLREHEFYYKKGLETIPFAGDAFFYRLQPNYVVFASSTEQLTQLINFLYSNGIAYCMRGAGTSYTGASVVNMPETVSIVTTRLNAIQQLDELNKWAVCEPGVNTFALANACATKNLFYPPDPASYKVCTIGGNAATNAGGPHCFLYGVTSGYINNLEVIIQGEIFKLGSGAEFACHTSLKDLMIGSEGTLAVFRLLNMRIIKVPPHHIDFLVEFASCSQAIEFIHAGLQEGLLPSVMDMSTKPILPGEQECGAYLFLSFDGGDIYLDEVRMKVGALLQPMANNANCTVVDNIWELRRKLVRKHVSHTIRSSGKPLYFLFDAVVPIAYLKPILYYCIELAAHIGLPLMNTFHAGDGNIHPTIFYDQTIPTDIEKLYAFLLQVLKKVLEYGGTLTGEHGVGIEKRELFTALEDLEIVKINRVIKTFFDPVGLANPGKCLSSAVDAEAYMSMITYASEKYKLAKLPAEMQPFLNGYNVLELRADATLNEIREAHESKKKIVPFKPLICPDKPISFYVRHNIPNLWAHLFSLRNLITGGCIAYKGSDLKIGKMTSKNVSGYNLNFLLFHKSSNPNSYYLKCYHPDLLDSPFNLFRVIVPAAKSTLFLVLVEEVAVNVILHHGSSQLTAIVHVFVHRHRQALHYLQEAAEKYGGRVIEVGHSNLSTPRNSFVYLVSLENKQAFVAVSKKLTKLNYIYSDLQKVFAITESMEKKGIIMESLADLMASGAIASIRSLDSENDQHEYLFLGDTLKNEIAMEDQLIARIMDDVNGF